MLMIFYGLTLDVGHTLREYMESRGFRVVYKLVYEDPNKPVKPYFKPRKLASKEAVEACDFKYPTNYGLVGFNKSDIFDAIYGYENAVLTMTSENIEFLRHIKTGYGDAVPIIGTCISLAGMKELFQGKKEMTEEEKTDRLAMKKTVAQTILHNRHLFDDFLIYDGEQSQFNLSTLKIQLDSMIEKAKEKQRRFLDTKYIEAPYQGKENYVFFSYAHKDNAIAKDILAFLQFHGIRLWYDAGIEPGNNWMNVIADKLDNSVGMILLSGKNAVASVHVQAEIRNALEWEKPIIKINLDDSKFDRGIEMYLRPIHQLNYGEIEFQPKNSILNMLIKLGTKKQISKNELSENAQDNLFGKEILS